MPEKSAVTPAASTDPTPTEVVIIGAGPVGLFQIFELGLLGINAHIIDSLAQVGGQCTELYPEKPIYDIPALPVCGAQELIDRLMEQAKPFNATFHLGQEVTEVSVQPDGKFLRGDLRRDPPLGRCGGDRRRASAPFSRAAWHCPASRPSKARACITASRPPPISTAAIC